MKASIQQFQETAARFAGLRAEVEQIVSTLNPVEMVTPTNLAEAKSQWLEQAENGIFTNPTFTYNAQLLTTITQTADSLLSIDERISTAKTYSLADEFYLSYLEQVISDAILTVLMAKSILAQNDLFLASFTLVKYGRPSASLVRHAKTLANTGHTTRVTQTELPATDYQRLLDVKLGADFIAEMFTWTMEQYAKKFPAAQVWPVKILDDCSAIDVRDKSSFGYPIIAIPSTRVVNGIKLAELIGHETECHWRNSQNAALLGLPKTDNETIYEGLAKQKDCRFNLHFGTEVSTPLPYYIIAEQAALDGHSFAEVARHLVGFYGLSPKRAWGFTYRTFRGISNCENPVGYAFTKDRAYLEGFYYIDQLPNQEILSFGTLDPSSLEALEEIMSPSDIRRHAVLDLNLQPMALQEILRRL